MTTDFPTTCDPAAPDGLERFVDAQAPVWPDVVAELSAGGKRSHWMWFVFPQIAGLGRSTTARRFAISGEAEARAYLAHATLGPRLIEATELTLRHGDRTLRDIFGTPDDLKFVSSMTLFEAVAPASAKGSPFTRALATFSVERRDARTLSLLSGAPPGP